MHIPDAHIRETLEPATPDWRSHPDRRDAAVLAPLFTSDGSDFVLFTRRAADLEQHAENGWSLHGLAEALSRMGRTAEAEDAERRFRAAWVHADVDIEASCYCRVSL